MINYETFCRLRQLRDEQGLKISQIAAELDLDPKTVANWIERATYHVWSNSSKEFASGAKNCV